MSVIVRTQCIIQLFCLLLLFSFTHFDCKNELGVKCVLLDPLAMFNEQTFFPVIDDRSVDVIHQVCMCIHMKELLPQDLGQIFLYISFKLSKQAITYSILYTNSRASLG